MKLLDTLFGRWYHIPGVKLAAELIFVIIPVAFAIRTFIFGLYQVPTGSMETTLLTGERFVADKISYWVRAPKRSEIIAFNVPDKSVCSQGYNYSKNGLINLFERYVYGPENWTKRVIGIPGDHVKGVLEDGHPVVYLNDQKLDESSYVNKNPLIALRSADRMRTITIRSYVPSVSYHQQPFYRVDPDLVLLNRETGSPFLIMPSTPLPDGKDEFDVTLGDNQYWVMGDNRLDSADSRAWGPLDGKLIHGKIVFRIWSSDSKETWFFIDLLKHPIDFWSRVRWSRCLQLV